MSKVISNETVIALIGNIPEGLCDCDQRISEEVKEYESHIEHRVTLTYTSNIITSVECEALIAIAKAAKRDMYAQQEGIEVTFKFTGYEFKKQEEDGE